MSTDHAFCPHCRQLLLADAPRPYPQRPVRCTGCRLLVGPGRARGADGAPRLGPLPSAGRRIDVVSDVLQDLRHGPSGGDLRDSGGAPHVL